MLYNIGKQSLQLPKLYYELAKDNQFDIDATLNADEILTLKSQTESFIPQQQNLNNKVAITTMIYLLQLQSMKSLTTVKH